MIKFSKYEGLVLLLTISTVFAACNVGERSFTIRNSCSQTVWVGEWWSRAGSAGSGGDGFQLDSGQSTDLCLASSWSGRFWGRTGCKFDANNLCNPPTSACCDTGSCLSATNTFGLKCSNPGVPPTTLAEFTLAPSVDFYDVSLVDGADIPVEIAPKVGTFNASKSDNYSCGAAGCTASTCPNGFPFSPCSWTFNGGIYENTLKMVKLLTCNSTTCNNCSSSTKTCSCSSNNDCPAGYVCGMNQIPGVGVVRACGTQIGWFGPSDLCSRDNSIQYPLNCTQAVSGQGTNQNLYGCTGVNAGSCYSTGANSSCCGCPSWSEPNTCKSTNPSWTSIASPIVSIFKNACPTGYSYPYDDLTSTFTCNPVNSTIGVGYTITFCPQGSSSTGSGTSTTGTVSGGTSGTVSGGGGQSTTGSNENSASSVSVSTALGFLVMMVFMMYLG